LYRFLKTPRNLPRDRLGGLDDAARKRRTNQQTEFLMEQYRQHRAAAASSAATGADRALRATVVAAEYLQLRRDVADRAALHALDAGAEEVLTPGELSRRAAARVGLRLPPGGGASPPGTAPHRHAEQRAVGVNGEINGAASESR
jgi:hypothetical protein